MSEHKPIDVQCGTEMGCRICHGQADVAYVLCPEHQGLSRAAPDLLAALEGAEWVRHTYESRTEDFFEWCECPGCEAEQKDGHKPDCQLAAAIKKALPA